MYGFMALWIVSLCFLKLFLFWYEVLHSWQKNFALLILSGFWVRCLVLLCFFREEWSSVKNKENLVDLKSSFLQIWFTKNLLHWTLLYNLPKQNDVQGHKISTYPRLSSAIWLLNKLKIENKTFFWASFFRLLKCILLYKGVLRWHSSWLFCFYFMSVLGVSSFPEWLFVGVLVWDVCKLSQAFVYLSFPIWQNLVLPFGYHLTELWGKHLY